MLADKKLSAEEIDKLGGFNKWANSKFYSYCWLNF
jgi:hypothetical protein